MKCIKFLALLGLAAAACVVLAATASATVVTSPTGTISTPTVHAVNSGGHIRFTNPIANIDCSSTFEGKIESHGSGVTAEGKLSTLDFTGCTNSWHVTTILPGSLIFHWTSGYNGTVTSTGMRIDATRLGVTCVYETVATTLGEFTGNSPALIHIEASVPINRDLSSGLCGTAASAMSGKYETTGAMYLDA